MVGMASGGDIKGTKGAEGQRLILCIFKHCLPVAGVAAFAPGVKAQFLFDIAQLVGDRVNTTEVGLQQVVDGFYREITRLDGGSIL